MSIAYFPQLYPDELLYSFLARYYQHSAYPRYVFAVEDIYASKNVRPSTEFISEMNEEFLGYLLRKMPLEELIEIVGEDKVAYMEGLLSMKLTYGSIPGREELKEGICRLYKDIKKENILSTHGGIGGNNSVLFSLLEEGDELIALYPTYQQLYSIPESIGAKVKYLKTKKEHFSSFTSHSPF